MLIGFMLVLSTAITVYLLRKIIWISHKAGLYDHPTECRKIHTDSTPHLGGAAIFVTFIVLSAVFPQLRQLPDAHMLFLTAGALFLIGIADDLAGMNPYKKLLAQTVIAIALASSPEYRITNLHGIMGIGMIEGPIAYALTVLLILAVVNAINLIDGINCLASGLALAGFTTLAICFHALQDNGFLSVCAIMAGALAAFIAYNRTPAKIFLGDSGSLLCGFLLTACAIRLLRLPGTQNIWLNNSEFMKRIPMVLAATLFVPLFDMIRVFMLRILSKRAPFSADRSHIHHRLLDAGYSHMQASSLLVGITLFAQAVAIFAPIMPFPLFLATLVLMAGSLSWLYSRREKGKSPAAFPGINISQAQQEKIEVFDPSGSYPQFIKHFLVRGPFHKKYKSKKMEEMEEMEVPVE